MIRFCDREVACAEYALLTGAEMINYFLPDHKDDIICVYDNFDTMEYIGMITYESYKHSIGVDGAIQREYVILNANIWTDTREYFERRARNCTVDVLLPVLNQDGELICFAYEDSKANREIRMLQELQENINVLQFTDIYPEVKYVKIYEFNELAFFFTKYLQKLNIPVEVNGEMWQDLFDGAECQAPDYECYTIYAEGIERKEKNWRKNLLKSVSVEFECIDKVYEANIKSGNIKDAEGNFLWLIERLKKEKEIIIIGTGISSLNVCDLLLANGIDIFCFMSEDEDIQKYRLFGKKVLSDRAVIKSTRHPVFLECCSENSAWGFGGVDGYAYRGYQRNCSFFLVKDYIDIPVGNLQNMLKGKKVILLGNLNLCYYVNHSLETVVECRIAYWDLLEENSKKDIKMKVTDGEEYTDDICILVEPQYHCYGEERHKIIQKKGQYFAKLREKGIDNITEYFSNNEVLISIQKCKTKKYTIPCLTPNKILLNISGHMSGNALIESLMSHHPDILMMNSAAVGQILGNMFLICVQLSEEEPKERLQEFWKICSEITTDETTLLLSNKEIFSEKMEELFELKEAFTSQELFVLIHIAYEKISGREISDVQNMLLYHEQREERYPGRINYEEWLCDEKVSGYSIMLTRNAYTRVGSFFRFCMKYDTFFYPRINALWEHMVYIKEDRKAPDHWKRFWVKFETLKLEPAKTLQGICNEVRVSWSENLLEEIFMREKVQELSADDIINKFNLKPAYNLYEEFFSDFDRFRINMMFSCLQRRFDYPCVSCLNFSRRQLQEMFLKDFRFEGKLTYANDYWKVQYRKDFFDRAWEYLERARMEEKCYDF